MGSKGEEERREEGRDGQVGEGWERGLGGKTGYIEPRILYKSN